MTCDNCGCKITNETPEHLVAEEERAVFGGPLAAEERACVCDRCYVQIMDATEGTDWRERLPAWAKAVLFNNN